MDTNIQKSASEDRISAAELKKERVIPPELLEIPTPESLLVIEERLDQVIPQFISKCIA